MTRWPLILTLLFGAALAHALTLTADTPWVVSASEPESIRRALDDVAADWYKVLGNEPIILREPPADPSGPVVYLGMAGAWLKDMVNQPWPGAESFALQVVKDGAGLTSLLASGADARGAIYAAYALSEELLGVDPWYFWVDKEPAYKGTVDVSDTFSKRWGPPTFQYRGWFINDEDLLSMFAPDPIRENVISLEMFDRIFETILRLRGNMAVPATFAFPDEQSQILAARRGLAINHHHIQVVGLNTYRWPSAVPYSYHTHPQILEKEWQACVDMLAPYEVVWTVGYRGKHDRPFWVDDPSLDTPEKRGAQISRAIATQVDMIRKVQPKATIICNLWMEGANLYHAGHIKLPEGVTLVWADDGAGVPRDEGRVAAGQGVYYHTAMLSGSHNQLSEMVPPGRIYAELGRFVKAGATKFFLVNVSDVRPVPLSTDCAMKFVWDASAYIDKTDQENMDAFFLDWSRRQFGDAVAADVARLYARYFDLPYHRRNPRTGDQRLDRAIRNLNRELSAALANGVALSATVLKGGHDMGALAQSATGPLAELVQRAAALEPRIPADRRAFYVAHVRMQAELHQAMVKTLAAMAEAVQAHASGGKPAATAACRRAVEASESTLAKFRMGEYGRWRDWYRGDRFVGIGVTRDALRRTLALLEGKTPPPVRRVQGYSELYQYQERFAPHFPLLYER